MAPAPPWTIKRGFIEDLVILVHVSVAKVSEQLDASDEEAQDPCCQAFAKIHVTLVRIQDNGAVLGRTRRFQVSAYIPSSTLAKLYVSWLP